MKTCDLMRNAVGIARQCASVLMAATWLEETCPDSHCIIS